LPASAGPATMLPAASDAASAKAPPDAPHEVP
jgi:hypothetical protein